MKKALSKLDMYCFNNDYKGYSLYDSHNSFIPFAKLGPTISFLSNQVIKRSPVNIRKFIGVKKEYNPKGVGLFLFAYTLQKKLGNPLEIVDLDERISRFYQWLKTNYSTGYSGHCWGYNYSWPKKDGGVVPPFTPSSVVTGFNIRAILSYYLLTKDKSCLEIIKGAEQFVLNDLPKTVNEEGVCFSYTPVKRDLTINANLLAAEILAYCDFVFEREDNIEDIKQILNFTMVNQNNDGSWYYSYDIESGQPRKQIDFHQGYILESIKRICSYSNIDINNYKKNIQNGLKFYKQNQFDEHGVSLWRLPKRWPVDIHNQSQGIITFSLFKEYNSDYYSFAKKIADWTIENMQDKNGHFYYQKWPIFTNKVQYMRWNQAWMMLALTTFLDVEKKE